MSTAGLPRLMLIADGFASGRKSQPAEHVQKSVVELVRAGLRFVQFRDHAADPDVFAETARTMVDKIRANHTGVVITINSRADLATELGCGVHVGVRTNSSGAVVEGPSGFSAHTLEQVQTAAESGFDYATFSPVFATQSHPSANPFGIEMLEKVCATVSEIPVYALGGITPNTVGMCREAGAAGVAVLSDLLDAEEPVERLDMFQRVLSA
ncbi:MAG: thiamine phosphate synthase [Rubricoccaceae bacterium]|nr:thiamine phosphate synthase [Rubricoccaceae bacterium]